MQVYDHEGDVATTYSGELDLRKTGVFATYNNRSYVPHWEAPCNNIEGSSDGKKFGNNIKPDEKLAFYRKGVCRALPLVSDCIILSIPSLVDSNANQMNNKIYFYYRSLIIHIILLSV